MTTDELKQILEQHQLWLSGKGGERADLTGARLTGVNLNNVDLRGADLWCADLSNANLKGAILTNAYLTGANLSGANLRLANLRFAILTGADLKGADLTSAILTDANLRLADLRGADLSGADLSGAKLGNTVVVQSGPFGSRHDYLVTLWHPEWDAEQVTAGCWRGTLDELEKRVASVYPDGRYRTEYDAAITYHRAMLEAAR